MINSNYGSQLYWRVIDTGAGYLIKSGEKKAKQRRFFQEKIQDEELCQDCNFTFRNSHLRDTYDLLVCDGCNDKDKYPLITKSEAMAEYLLNETIFKINELKFDMRKNPHNAGWGEMKLFLLSQIEEVALKKWESWDKLEEEKYKRKIRSADLKQKQFDKKLAKLRYETRLKKVKTTTKIHEHEFNKIEDLGDDKFRKSCDCGFSKEYEVM